MGEGSSDILSRLWMVEGKSEVMKMKIVFHILALDFIRKTDKKIVFRFPIFFYISPEGKDLININGI